MGSLVKWLREETHNQEVVSSYLGSSYEIHIFTLICCKILIEKNQKSTKKRSGLAHFYKKYNEMKDADRENKFDQLSTCQI